VLYSGEGQGLVYHLKKDGWHYQLSQINKWREAKEEEKHFKEQEQIAEEITIYRLDVNLLHSNKDVKIESDEELPGYTNFYNVADGVEPALFVKKYSTVRYNNIYNGIDLIFYESKDGQLEYDFIVAPGADYKQINLQFEGAEISINEQNELILVTPMGTIVEGPLKVFQGDKSITAEWKLNKENNSISLIIPNYDTSLPLRIDPLVRVWGTYYGGSGDDVAYSCTTDTLGNVYLAGYTTSSNTIATTGAHQTVKNIAEDASLVKFNELGVLQWGTYYGGNDDDFGVSCAIGFNYNIYLSGYTKSSSSIATIGAHQPSPGGATGGTDAFLVKFDNLGTRQWGTYYGGSAADYAGSCNTDSDGNIFICGYTSSSSAIASAGSHQEVKSGSWDAYIVKFNSSGQRQWGTYYGGSSADHGEACYSDNKGNIYLSGRTSSTTAIATAGSHQPTHGGGSLDAFLVKLNSLGVRQWGTYYGGAGDDIARSCVVDTAFGDFVYLAGQTTSTTSISTSGAHQVVYGGGAWDAFLVKLR
jgi:hypothetical protein